MSQQATDAVVVYADYVCPFCYLGYESLDQYQDQREQPVPTDWHPFDLRSRQRRPDGTIDHSVDNGKDEEYYEQAKQNVERLADEYGVEMDEPLKKNVDSYDAQRVAYRVREEHPEQFEQFHRSVFDALWEDDRDIGRQDVLEDLAEAADVPPEVVSETLNDESSAQRLESAFEAAQKQRITGVPTFVYGEHAARGAVPPEQLRRLIEGN
ncbi:thioredoxin domain-containing protein [Halovenus sp. WSH3]|uniref:Thioredoxin domain-containing protein n=1 Tax=Halovenus carboxidivorans TaxID=2692199 RepID=A0A6B0T8B1_9EURY|nr:DsbA family protein [Halovenus carboxidivorans]MXR52456.1 thioredoxin domain-containing protein [Halovenus carboxidivorans]